MEHSEYWNGFLAGWFAMLALNVLSAGDLIYRSFRHKIFGPKFKQGDIVMCSQGKEEWEPPFIMRIEGGGKNKYQTRYYISEVGQYGPSTFAAAISHVDSLYKLINEVEKAQWIRQENF